MLRKSLLAAIGLIAAVSVVGLARAEGGDRPAAATTGSASSRPTATADTAPPAAAPPAPESVAPAAAVTSSDSPDEKEQDRLIDLFQQRAVERGGSLEFRQLGLLLLDRADDRADLGDYRAALDAFAQALERDPNHPDSLVGQGRAALGLHEFTTALTATDRLERSAEDGPEALALIGDTAFAVGDYERASAAFTRLRARVGDDPAVLVRLAGLAGATGGADTDRLTAEALIAAEEADLTAGDLAFYQTFAGRQAFDRGDLVTAAAQLERAVAGAPDDHGALGELARVRAAAGDPASAVELLETANALVPEPDHLTLQGDLKLLLGREADAAADHSAAVALAERDDDHRRAWARSLATHHLDHLDRGGDLRSAVEIAVAERELRRDVGAYDLRAWAAFRSGDLATARSEIDLALAFGTGDATIWYHAARISAAEGDLVRAADELDAALVGNPGFDPLLALDAERLRSEIEAAPARSDG